MTRRRVLVVSPDAGRAEVILGWLAAAGFDARYSTNFFDARLEVDEEPPALLVTDVRLGAFNGLQLAIRAHQRNAGTRAIVIGSGEDRVLQAEAHRAHARFLVVPMDEATFSRAVEESLAEYRPGRRSVRKRVPRMAAFADDAPASVVDISIEGLRLELSAAEGGRLPQRFVVRVPQFAVSCPMRCVWMAEAPRPGVVWCGAAVDAPDWEASLTWRELADAIPGWTLIVNPRDT